LHFGYSHRLKDALSLRVANRSVASFSAPLDRLERRLPHFSRNDSRAFSDSKDSKTQEGTMDSRLRGNDNLRWEGKETLFKRQTVRE
jgi:hypothetical protein